MWFQGTALSAESMYMPEGIDHKWETAHAGVGSPGILQGADTHEHDGVVFIS